MRTFAILSLVLGLGFASILPEAEEYFEEGGGRNGGNPRIVGGTAASKNEFPYQLRAVLDFGSSRYGLCGASIINSKYALIAAHCVAPVRPKAITLQVGYLDVTAKTGGEYDVYVEYIKVHPDFDSNNFRNDVALLRISETFTNTPGSQPIELAGAGADSRGNAVATGWGTTIEEGPTSNILMKVTLPILDNQFCRNAYGSGFDSNIMICAGYLGGGRDTCQGDSGGPLALNGIQVGVTSFGYGCARPGFPGVYARVSAFKSWIDANAV